MATSGAFANRSRMSLRSCGLRGSPLAGMTPDLLPVATVLVGDAAVAVEELVRDLEHCDHDAALGRPGDMAAAWFAPHELAGADRQAFGRAFLVDQLSGDHIGLL